VGNGPASRDVHTDLTIVKKMGVRGEGQGGNHINVYSGRPVESSAGDKKSLINLYISF